jgi:hypothetical protein
LIGWLKVQVMKKIVAAFALMALLTVAPASADSFVLGGTYNVVSYELCLSACLTTGVQLTCRAEGRPLVPEMYSLHP